VHRVAYSQLVDVEGSYGCDQLVDSDGERNEDLVSLVVLKIYFGCGGRKGKVLCHMDCSLVNM
jgi:hypothetical protein